MRELRLEFGDKVAHHFAMWLAVGASTVIEQPLPMIERVLVDRSTSPPASARNRRDEVGADASFNPH
jgi:hypothetical protein